MYIRFKVLPNSIMKPFYFILLLSILVACSTEKEKEIVILPFEDRDISVQEKIKLSLTKEYLSQNGFADSSLTFLKEFYSQRDYAPKWINDSLISAYGLKIKKTIGTPYAFGIPVGRFKQVETKNYIQDELYLTLSMAQIIYDLDSGIINFDTKTLKPRRYLSSSILDTINFTETDLRVQLLKFGPQDSNYQAIAKGLITFVDSIPMDTSTFSIESIKYDVLFALEKTKVALVSKGYLENNVSDSTEIIEGLKRFQIDNSLKPDGVIGKFTSRSLNESTYHKVERAILAMDKLRNQKKRPEKYIYINIPEYKLRFYINDSLKSDHNIVVGKNGNDTPELTSKLRKIVVYPYWNVPYSISSKEILPHLKRNSNYLAEHDYIILKNGEKVDPDTVNWKTIRRNAFPYKVQQQPGPKNSLGIIKFDFYNKHSVYFHDTPSKSLFGVDVRAYSHGCMRTQNPIDLAKIILERDERRSKFNEMTPDSLDTLLGRAENIEIKLLERIPIFIEYLTVTRTGDRMSMYLDIYGRDEEYLKIMREE